ncbi:hypothetical protein ABZ798_31255, partial [Streptomyces sp. NPDC047803]
TTKSGLTGSLVTATAPNVKKKSKCTTDGKTYARPFRFAPGAMSRVASLPGPRKARAFSPLRCVNAVNGHRSAMP